MKSQRSAVALGVMVAALLIWMLVRARIPSPSTNPTKGNVPTAPPASSPVNMPATRTPPPDIPTPQNSPSGPTPTTTAREPSTPTQAASPTASPGATISAAASPAASSESASVNAIRVRRMITDYHTLAGENPIGTNAEIMATVMGKNPRQAVVGPPEGLGLNTKGELIDEWGTPYFFHQLSKDVMEIHSAGPDRIMGTSDDVIVR